MIAKVLPIAEPLALTMQPDIFYGYMAGFRQPVALLNMRVHDLSSKQLHTLEKALHYYFSDYHIASSLQSLRDVIESFSKVICNLQQAGGLPIFEKPVIEKSSSKKNEFSLWIPFLFPICFHPVAIFIMKFFNYYLLQPSFMISQSIVEELNSLLNTLKMHAPRGSNSLRFLKAAFETKIPWRHIANNTFQYGYGKFSRWLDSSFTDKTPHISATLIENKKNIAYVLSQAGFPVAENYIANSEIDALRIAQKLNYPVVVKPIDGRAGKGVYTYLNSEDHVKKAFYATKKHTSNVMVEKHIVGRDYRLLVFNGEMIWAIERLPASVTGDGISDIQTLIAKHNQDHQSHYPLRHIQINEDILDYLSEQHLSLQTVISAGKFIALTRIANISMGGTPVKVEKIHPDNQHLVESAAKLLRLDLVGIDFISPDIQQSYRENGGKIIEVNVQPQLGSTTAPHIYQQILSSLIPDQGRIPIIIIFGNKNNHLHYVEHIQNYLKMSASKIGLAISNSVIMNNVEMDMPSLFTAGQHLLMMDDMDMIIYWVNDDKDIEKQGLPFDCYDDLILLEDMNIDLVDSMHKNMMLNTLIKACSGEIIIANNTSHHMRDLLCKKYQISAITKSFIDYFCFENTKVGQQTLS